MSMLEGLLKLDTELFLALNGMHGTMLDDFMHYVSQVWTWIPLYAGMIIYMVRRWKMEAIWIILAMVLCLVLTDQISTFAKNSIERLRPTHNPELEGLVHQVRGHEGGLYGFFSSHASNVFGYALLTSLIIKNSVYSAFIFVWAVLVSYSRIYLGVHYPLDILAGMLFGMGVALLTYWLLNSIQKKLIAQIKTRFFLH